jgi:hypothetical protein
MIKCWMVNDEENTSEVHVAIQQENCDSRILENCS